MKITQSRPTAILVFILEMLVLATCISGCEFFNKEKSVTEKVDEIERHRIIKSCQDQVDLQTYFYNRRPDGKYVFVGTSTGYPIPYGSHYLAKKPDDDVVLAKLLQIDQDKWYTSQSTDGYWLIMPDPKIKRPMAQFIGHDLSIFTFPLPKRLLSK